MMFKNLFSKLSTPDHENFARTVGQRFANSLQKYNPRVDGIGHGYYFNNFIVVTILDGCMVRFILDRNDIFVETAPLNSPPITREINTINMWIDVSIVTSWLDDKGKTFKWFYQYGDDKKMETQLVQIEPKLKSYWDGIIELYANNFTKHQNEFFEFRKLWAKKSWEALGWNASKNLTSPRKSVIGHFPQFAEVATDLGITTSYFGMEEKVWKTLWAMGSENMFWEVDKRFLDDAIDKRQDEIVLATEARNPESFFSREIKYLANKLDM